MSSMTTTNSTDVASFDEYGAVLKTLHLYIDNAGISNGEAMRTAFYDHAHVLGSIGGEFTDVGIDDFTKEISSSPKSPEIKYHVAFVDVSGPAASAKVEFVNWLGQRFTDYFLLYKENGEWKITGKVYNSHSNN